ncbi:BrnT family toxin [uncultured Enterovirga sp.]|uniref:BrnT family toxin n=1 Tax=uncultured Enterovirga sp. TaxID=2026352 RepID=UPI0035C9E06A
MGETDDFTWDDDKDALTFEQRALRLVMAAQMFDGRVRLERPSKNSMSDALRVESMAEVDGRVLFCVWTWRGERRRIISLRPASRSERRAYREATR